MTETTQIWRQGDVIFVQGPPSIRDACRVLPGCEYLSEYKTWRYPATPAVAGSIFSAFGERAAVYDTEFRSLLHKWRRLVNRENDRQGVWPSNVTLQPWNHQLDAYRAIQGFLGTDTGAAGLFAGMGTGKTLVATAIIAARKWRRVLIVCPGNMIQTWARELESRITDVTVTAVPLTGPSKKRTAEYKDNLNNDGQTIFITNYEGVWRPELRAALEAYPPDAVILDEAQAVKSAGSKVSQFMYRLGKKVPYRLALTGTPAHDKILDVYGVYRFLDPGIFGTNYNRFFERYATYIPGKGGQYKILTGYQNEEELSDKMYRIAFRVTEDVLDLPETTDTTLLLDLSDKGMKTYRQFERDMVLELDDRATVAGNVLTKLLRLQQIAAGFIPMTSDETGETSLEPVDTSKADALKELLQDIPESEPVVVFAKFIQDLRVIREAVESTGRRYLEESGRRHEWREWQEDLTGGEVIGVQVDAGSAGIDLTRAAYAVYYTVGFSLGNYQQSRRRVHRPGQERPVHYYHLVAKGTVDETIQQALKSKQSLADYVVEELRHKDPGK